MLGFYIPSMMSYLPVVGTESSMNILFTSQSTVNQRLEENSIKATTNRYFLAHTINIWVPKKNSCTPESKSDRYRFDLELRKHC